MEDDAMTFRMPDSWYDPPEPYAVAERFCATCHNVQEVYGSSMSRGRVVWNCAECQANWEETDEEDYEPTWEDEHDHR